MCVCVCVCVFSYGSHSSLFKFISSQLIVCLASLWLTYQRPTCAFVNRIPMTHNLIIYRELKPNFLLASASFSFQLSGYHTFGDNGVPVARSFYQRCRARQLPPTFGLIELNSGENFAIHLLCWCFRKSSYNYIILYCLLTFYWPHLLPSSPWIKTKTDPDRESLQEASSRSACLIRRLRLFCIINMKRWEERIFSCCMGFGSWIISLLQAVTQSERGRSMCVSTHTLLSPRPATHHHINALEVIFFYVFFGLMRNNSFFFIGFCSWWTFRCCDVYFTSENPQKILNNWGGNFFYPGGAN